MSRKGPDMVRSFVAFASVAAGALGFAATAGAAMDATSPPPDAPQAVKDAWLDGHLDAVYALNEHLGPFGVSANVTDGTVEVVGEVETEIERDLALEIARGMPGVREVKSSLVVDGGKPPAPVEEPGAPPSFRQLVDDATATANVRRNLAGNGNTRNLKLQVTTENGVVTLKGAVMSRKHKMLAEMIARNTDGITNVRNELEIQEPTET